MGLGTLIDPFKTLFGAVKGTLIYPFTGTLMGCRSVWAFGNSGQPLREPLYDPVISGFGFRVSGFGFRVWGFGFEI